MLCSIPLVTQMLAEIAHAQMALAKKRLHPELFRERKRLLVTGQGFIRIFMVRMGQNIAKQPQPVGLVPPLSTFLRKACGIGRCAQRGIGVAG